MSFHHITTKNCINTALRLGAATDRGETCRLGAARGDGVWWQLARARELSRKHGGHQRQGRCPQGLHQLCNTCLMLHTAAWTSPVGFAPALQHAFNVAHSGRDEAQRVRASSATYS